MSTGKEGSRRLNIAHLFQASQLRFHEPGAVQLHIFHTIQGLRQAGHRVALVALQGRRVLWTEDPQVFESDSLSPSHFARLGLSGAAPFKLFESGVRRIQTELKLPYLALFDSQRMYDACRQNLHGYDLIHERYNLLSLGGTLASRRLGIPYVLEVNADLIEEREFQGTPERGLRRRFALWATKYCFDAADRIICVSAPLKDHLIKKWAIDADKIVVVSNAADTKTFGSPYDTGSIRRRFGLTNEPVVMFVGGFYAWHDLPLLVESFASVVRQVPQARLMLVGDGRTRSVVEQTIAEHGLQHAVIMAGRVAHSQIPEMLAIADVAVAPNVAFFNGHGGSPLKVFEYMAAGKAIVATKTGQVAEVIEEGRNGLLVEPRDAPGFANAITTLLNDPAERSRLGQNARQQAVEQHSWEHYSRKLEEIYLSVL